MEIWLDRESKRNALNAEMRARIIEILEGIEDQGVRVVLLRARGTVFCAGLDLNERADTLGKGESPIEPVLEAVRACPLPVVAVMQGDALAGGCELVLACDLVLASPKAGLGMPLIKLGMLPKPRLVANVIDALGQNTARAMFMLGERIPVSELVQTRAIWRMVPEQELESAAADLGQRLAEMPQLALRTVKATLNRLTDRSNMSGISDIEAMVLAVQRSADAQEGIRAHLDRRPPVFRGE